MEIVRQTQQLDQTSPFEALKGQEDGRDFWSARAMQQLLGYQRWGNFQGAVSRMARALENSGENPADHMLQVKHMVEIGSGAKRQADDYQLSRLAAYLLAMNGDPENPQVAQAQLYFAQQTRRAELTQQQAEAQALEDLGRRELVHEIKYNAKEQAREKMARQVVTLGMIAHAYGKKRAAAEHSLQNEYKIAPAGWFEDRTAKRQDKTEYVYPMLAVYENFRAGMGPFEGKSFTPFEGEYTKPQERRGLGIPRN